MNVERSQTAYVSAMMCVALLAGCASQEVQQIENVEPIDTGSASATATFEVGKPEMRHPVTRIEDSEAAQRLLSAKGVTLQWIDWDRRGSVNARMKGETLLLTAVQNEVGGPGRLFLEGYVSEVGSDYFIFEGEVTITDTPDRGRSCKRDKSWRFAITQNRPYWRLREFEWCDGLTDYVDIYF